MNLQAATDAACKVCAKPIANRRSTLQTRCIPCVIAAANAKDKATAKAQRQAAIDARKKDAADTRARRIALKSRRDWMAEAQKAFNAWVRVRDAALPCVSCGRHHEGQYHAGHYLTVGARPELRFTPNNVHKQCSACNTHLHGNLILYRVELVKRIGLAAVEALEGPHEPAKYTVDELRQIRDTYRAKARSLKAQLETA
jgi:hypothetical protein